MRPALLLIAGTFAIVTFVDAETAKMPEHLQELLQESTQFRDVSSVKQLPKSIVDMCADSRGKLANPREKWNAGCLVNEKRASSRLNWAVTNGEYFVVHYETGGIALVQHLRVIRLKANAAPALVWQDDPPVDGYKNYDAYLKALTNMESQRDDHAQK